jgi:AraC-like DNA-binding protein
MANGGLEASHADVQVFKFSDIGKESVKETPLFKTNFYQIGLFSEVRFEVNYFGNQQVVDQKNVVVMFKPGQTCSFSKTDPNAKGYAIMFKENFIDWRLNNSNTLKDFSILNPAFNCVLFLSNEVFTDLIEIAQKMYIEYNGILDDTTLNITKLYSQLLIEKINRLCVQSENLNLNKIYFTTTQTFKSLVYQNIHKTKNVSDYAEMLCMTEKTLINHIKQITTFTPKEFINQLIIAESKAMLSSKATIDEVSTYFNFTDQAHFSNFFKKHTGHSPFKFKNSN